MLWSIVVDVILCGGVNGVVTLRPVWSVLTSRCQGPEVKSLPAPGSEQSEPRRDGGRAGRKEGGGGNYLVCFSRLSSSITFFQAPFSRFLSLGFCLRLSLSLSLSLSVSPCP